MDGMAKKPNGNGHRDLARAEPQTKVSTLGHKLRVLSDKVAKSNTKPLSYEEIRRIVIANRGGTSVESGR
jgi:hypothetical protein